MGVWLGRVYRLYMVVPQEPAVWDPACLSLPAANAQDAPRLRNLEKLTISNPQQNRGKKPGIFGWGLRFAYRPLARLAPWESRRVGPQFPQAHPENRRSWEMAENFVFLFRKFVTGTDTSEILFEGVVE